MSDLSRRGFLGAAAAVTGTGVVGAALPGSDAQAAPQESPKPADRPKHRRHGDIRDIKHVVILMQENRSFDHYFGSLQGVRGFGDRSTITLPGGRSVFQQPTTPPGTPVTRRSTRGTSAMRRRRRTPPGISHRMRRSGHRVTAAPRTAGRTSTARGTAG